LQPWTSTSATPTSCSNTWRESGCTSAQSYGCRKRYMDGTAWFSS